jgi:hypothetical protein
MNTFVRVASIVLIVVGVIVMLAAIFGGFAGIARLAAAPVTGGSFGPGFRGNVRPLTTAGTFGLTFVISAMAFIQGLAAAALGGGLYLLARLDWHLRHPATVMQPAPATGTASAPQAPIG